MGAPSVASADVYKLLLSDDGRAGLGNDPLAQAEAVAAVNEFLATYPRRTTIPQTATDQTLREFYARTLQTAVDVLTEATTPDGPGWMAALLAPSRRLYVGVWVVVLSLVLYLIDAAA